MKRSSLLAICFLLAAFQFSTAQSSKKSQVAILTTDFGEMTILLYDKTPKHRDNFIKLVEEGFFDGQGFHRVIKNFMIQGGDPNSKEGGDQTQIGQGARRRSSVRSGKSQKRIQR
jgi:peptidylprolyl isomerase/peptidyl-prolyl cis-trans isomerase B (cyclophilin B)